MPDTKLVTCGCSFTQQDGWARHVKAYFEYADLLNLSVGGGTNTTQINRINDFVLSNTGQRSVDIIWQITYPSRISNLRLPRDHPDVIAKKYMPWHDRGFTYAQPSPLPNYIDQQRHMDILHDEYVMKKQDIHYCNINNDISRLLCTMLLLKKVSRNLLVFFGANNIENNIIIKMEEFFIREKIAYVSYDNNLLDYVNDNNLELADDKFHPAKQSYTTYADEILIPTIVSQWQF
jgi:hypothetical protein